MQIRLTRQGLCLCSARFLSSGNVPLVGLQNGIWVEPVPPSLPRLCPAFARHCIMDKKRRRWRRGTIYGRALSNSQSVKSSRKLADRSTLFVVTGHQTCGTVGLDGKWNECGARQTRTVPYLGLSYDVVEIHKYRRKVLFIVLCSLKYAIPSVQGYDRSQPAPSCGPAPSK